MDSTNTLPQIYPEQRYKEVTANELFAAASPAMAYAMSADTTGGLTFGYFGARFDDSTLIAAGTHTCGASTTVYMVVSKTTGAVSFATDTTNWDDHDNYGQAYMIVAGASTLTSWLDCRGGRYGISASIGPQGLPGADGADGADGAAGADGAPGADGVDGATWRTGSGVPSNALGADGDFYLDSGTGNVYVKASGIYTVGANIQGPPGADGADGAPGADGGAADIAADTHAASSKATPVDADELPLLDSAAAWVLKRLTWANLKATLKTYLDTVYLLATTLDTDPTLAANSAAKVPSQSAVKSYVDGKVAGLSWKQSVRAATTAAGTLASSFESGDAIDGVTLATGDRILLKNQATASENGIYTVNASGAPTRAPDADSGSELVNATVYVSEGSTLADTQWTCTTNAPITVGSTSLAFAQLSSGGGLTNFSEVSNTSSPNNVVGATSLTALSSLSTADIVVSPKGTGAILAQVPDASTTGGLKRGAGAVDLQMSRASSNQVASGSSAVIAGGNNNRASGNTSFVGGGTGNWASSTGDAVGGGQANTASGGNAVVAGGGGSSAGNTASGISAGVLAGRSNVASASDSAVGGGQANTASGTSATVPGGASNTADGSYSIASGSNSNALGLYGARVHASGRFAINAHAQRVDMTLRCETTNATQTTLTADQAAAGSTNQLVLPNSSAYVVRGRVIARQNTTGDTAAWEFTAVIRRGANAAATAMVAAASVTSLAADSGASAWALAVDADTTNGSLRVRFTGEASKTIRTTCSVDATQTVL